MSFVLRALPWSEFAPLAATLDLAPARRVAAEVLASDATREAWMLHESIDRALIAEYGAWAAGWCWSPHDGGMVRAYCCPAHSLARRRASERADSVERIALALSEWHALLTSLDARFASLREDTATLSVEEGVERAAAQLLPLVVERTDAEDAWYSSFERVLRWYLESGGHDLNAVGSVVQRVVSGRFSSWVAPDAASARDACAELGLEVALAAEQPPRDALALWRRARSTAFANPPSPRSREVVRVDGHARYVETHDRPRDPLRADRMRAALAACRASARRDEPLTIERLAAWQAIVLGEEAPPRVTDAFAKGGRERYAIDASTRARLADELCEAGSGEALAVRAARVYLDVCFAHPFVDGNARAARLALDHTLTRAGCALHAAAPVFALSRGAADAEGAWSLAWLLGYLIGPREDGATGA